eukprot:TRINITY_DN6812_c0_g1_i2.p1 TRINITY_DN6812_c0_g1~~TRINITY_DN6812_c0_g1_i2.p1  ORF type:complete len:727 (-),score=63.26 TRINITY_DN6812_c0_g1_i2:431-2611(-)
MATASQGSPSQQGRRILLAGMRFLLGAIFLGYLMVWILSPTNLWLKNWNVQVDKHAKSTYFGKQGSTLLIFSFPILFIAALGCLYLHLGKKDGNYMERNGENSRLDFWKRPFIVKGPLGVVSAMELAFLAMFIALLIWTYSTRLTVRFSEINRGINHHHNHNHDHDKRWQLKLRTSAYNLGLVGNICCAFLFFPVTRGSSILPLVGLTSEASIKYHIWLGHMAMVLFTAHGLCYFLYWAITHDLEQLLRWDKVGVSNVAGEIALVFGIVMWVAVLPRIRRQKFELFFYTHQLYFLFLLFYVLHVGIAFFALILPGVYLFLIDRYLRFLQSRQKVRLVSTRLLPCETLELNFTKSPGLVYTPTSVVFVNVPSISSLQWHPFTVSSSCNLEPDNLSVIIKKEGTWSQKLYNMLSSPLDRLDVSVEGPYGPAAVDFLRHQRRTQVQGHDTLVLVSGGSGITPFISIIRKLIFISTTLTSPTPRIVLISAFKTSADLTMLDLLLPISATNSPISNLQLQLEAFVTREKEPPSTNDPHKLIQTIWFKPHTSDAPISPVLGPNGWLWLGAIISSSFVMYLILVGILTRYYIFPIDHNNGDTYSTPAKALLNTLFICFCIAVTASVAMLWNKKSMEGNQIGSVEMSTPSTTFPSSWSWGSDGDVENLPRQSLVQSSKLHYGARPPLKRMLLETEGSSVGVLVSGPKEMRHDVATVCSSGQADRLHFEAISFNW